MSPLLIECKFFTSHLFEPNSFFRDTNKYDICIIISKSDKEIIDKIRYSINEVIKEEWGINVPDQLRIPLRDGDYEKGGVGIFEDSYFMNAYTTNKPKVLDKNNEKIEDSSLVRRVEKGRVLVKFEAYNVNGQQGVRVLWGLTQIIRELDDEWPQVFPPIKIKVNQTGAFTDREWVQQNEQIDTKNAYDELPF